MMALHFRYTLVQMPYAVLSLGGRWVRPRPIVPIELTGPRGSWQTTAKLDTGADDTIFPERYAQYLGLDLSQAPTGFAGGVGQARIYLKFAQIRLRLTDGHEVREWPAWVGFTPAPLKRSLLGFAGCLQFFDALFRGGTEEVEWTPNPLYPGT